MSECIGCEKEFEPDQYNAHCNECGDKAYAEMWERENGRMAMSKTINQLVQDAHQNAVSKGWWEEDRSFGEIIALIHSEASEALEDYREGYQPTEMWYEWTDPNGEKLEFAEHETEIIDSLGKPHYVYGKPCGIPSELADIVIRVFDACGRYGINLEKAIAEKMAYNATRPHKHGGKVI
jgi:NTP pyrophosphatase (non-canonical NTP hydrolase)